MHSDRSFPNLRIFYFPFQREENQSTAQISGFIHDMKNSVGLLDNCNLIILASNGKFLQSVVSHI